MITLEQIDARLKRIEKAMHKQELRSKNIWLNGKAVAKLTGWNANKMRSMREQGVVEFKRNGGRKIVYLQKSVENIPKQLLRK